MSFNTAITGLKAASTMLDVTGNNIANVATTGFKSSRTEFADIYATSVVGAGSSNTPGSGVIVNSISQDFSAGTLEFTNNNLDLAINGSGFFQLSDGQGGTTYSRAGAFELNKEGEIVSKTGKFLQGYGLDNARPPNRLPIGNLKVDQKESPPKATEVIDLSFNIDARSDASKLLPVYNKDEPGSFTYTTTLRTFDSLGNEQSIKFNFAEQRPIRQQFTYDVTAVSAFSISGIDLTEDDFDADGNIINLGPLPEDNKRSLLMQADPRIDINTVRYSVDSNNVARLRFELISAETNTGRMVVNNTNTTSPLVPSITERPANESRSYTLDFNNTSPVGSIEIGGVTVQIASGQDEVTVAQAIKNREAQILDRNPEIESVNLKNNGIDPPEIQLIFKADVGTILPNRYQPVVSFTGTLPGEISFGNSTVAFDPANPAGTSQTALPDVDGRVVGDNSFLGKYRMYAYLNNNTLLDVGKVQDPGVGTETEPGSILVSFDPTSGLLNGLNVFGNTGKFDPGTQVPAITIKGSDPARPTTEVSLDLSNSTQFASASIVKNQQQDGYAKGDLIGVTFAPTGEMIASFSNGQNQPLGQVAFATFENQDGLQPAGDTEWIATLASGNAILNPPGTGLNGTLRSAALEQSNVDLSTELVNLIKAQRNFQASSKTLETANNITQTILNI